MPETPWGKPSGRRTAGSRAGYAIATLAPGRPTSYERGSGRTGGTLMDIRKITDDFAVAPQVRTDEMADLKAQGFRSIISNRPDGEAADQPSFAEIEQAARAAGLEVRHVPVVTGRLEPKDVDAFGRALDEMPGPVLAFCRSGTRSTTLWSLNEAGKRPDAEILERTRAAGYDMSAVVARGRPRQD